MNLNRTPNAMCANWAHDNVPADKIEDDGLWELVTNAWDAGWDAAMEVVRERAR